MVARMSTRWVPNSWTPPLTERACTGLLTPLHPELMTMVATSMKPREHSQLQKQHNIRWRSNQERLTVPL